ncbi:DNA-methyltransferase [Rhodopirellula sallentina]|nr:site-specific DNA-methyltransferase [Rhodopirellula sallentina]
MAKKKNAKPKDEPGHSKTCRRFDKTKFGETYLGDSQILLSSKIEEKSVDLIMTSPPFGLVRKKAYGNVDADDYLDWFRPFGELFRRVLKDSGSLVIDIGGAWIPGQPTRSLYHYELLIMLCKEFGFHLAQDFFWWNPAKLPTPAEWVTVRRVRVKDAVNCVWWLSATPWPKASNRRVLTPYSDSMKDLLKNGYIAKKRPSGHDISEKFSRNNGASIPPNLLPFPNTDSNSYYLRYCKEHDLPQHPARFPAELPEYFIRMLTDPGDTVVDPFAGSCITGEVAERLERRWVCCELVEDYLLGAKGRFATNSSESTKLARPSYSVSSPAVLWNGVAEDPLAADGGKERPKTMKSKSSKKAKATDAKKAD